MGPEATLADRREAEAQGASRPQWAWAAAYVLGAILILALEHLWRGQSYWLYSEGVYLATAREVLRGAGLYTEVAAAQPPPFFYLGVGLLSISDSLLFVRAALAATTVASGGLVAVVVARLTGRPGAAVAAGFASLVLPWTLREHATLTPDPLAAAPLLGGALLAARSGAGSAVAGGALAALAGGLKLAFLLPAVATGIVARRRAAFLGGLAAAVALGAVASLAIWGGAFYENVVGAQRDTGLQLESLPGQVAQTIWNIGPLVLLASITWIARSRARDPALLRTMLGLLAGTLALGVTFLKDGTYLNTLALMEPPALGLAAVGLIWLLEDPAILAARRRAALAVAALACALVAAQSASVVLLPETPLPFGNPFLSRAPGHELSAAEVERAAASAEECPEGNPYSGSPFIAFVAGRSVPGGQPDRFIVEESRTHRELLAEVARDRPLCPYGRPGGLPRGGNAVGSLK
jgi:hypothetical protein